jgi:hypothetical protein
MRLPCLLSLILVGLTCQQAAQPATAAAAAENTAAVTVGPDDAVITLDGFCADSARRVNTCKTVITRAQFEKLTEALQPGMTPAVRLSVANAYARNLRMSAAAEQRGLDQTPAFAEEMRFARMQLLAQDLNRVLQADAANITDTDVEEYYKTNEPSYEQAIVARIYVPHTKQIVPAGEQHEGVGSADVQSDATRAEAMTRVAADIRARAVKGEDPDTLQIQAYAESGSPRSTANTLIEKVRRASLPPAHETVLDLKPGAVSEIFSDPGGAHFIYKMISKQKLTLQEVTPEIRSAISEQRYRDSMRGFQTGVVLSDAYFNPPGESGAAAKRTRRRDLDNIAHSR